MADPAGPPAPPDAVDAAAAREDAGRGAGEEPVVRLFSGREVKCLAGLDDAPARLGKTTLLWIDVPRLSEETAGRVAETLDLDDEARRALAEPSATRFRDAGAFVHLTVHAPDLHTDDLIEVECLVGENWVVTAHGGPVSALGGFAELTSGSGPTGELGGLSFLAALLEWVLNEYATAFDRLEQELEAFDERAMRGERRPEERIDELVALRRRAGRLRRSLAAHRQPLLVLAHPELGALGDEASARRFELLLDRFEATVQTARDTRESIVSSFDVLLARTGHRTNEIVKILTLASVILLPGSLLAGVMGMNFEVGIFDHPGVFWIVLGVIVAVAVVTLVAARTRDWI